MGSCKQSPLEPHTKVSSTLINTYTYNGVVRYQSDKAPFLSHHDMQYDVWPWTPANTPSCLKHNLFLILFKKKKKKQMQQKMCLAHLERCLRSPWKEFKLSGIGHWNNFRLELPPKGHSGRWGSSLCCLGWFKISTTLRDRLINWNCDEHIHEKLSLQLQLWAWAHLQLTQAGIK